MPPPNRGVRVLGGECVGGCLGGCMFGGGTAQVRHQLGSPPQKKKSWEGVNLQVDKVPPPKKKNWGC